MVIRSDHSSAARPSLRIRASSRARRCRHQSRTHGSCLIRSARPRGRSGAVLAWSRLPWPGAAGLAWAGLSCCLAWSGCGRSRGWGGLWSVAAAFAGPWVSGSATLGERRGGMAVRRGRHGGPSRRGWSGCGRSRRVGLVVACAGRVCRLLGVGIGHLRAYGGGGAGVRRGVRHRRTAPRWAAPRRSGPPALRPGHRHVRVGVDAPAAADRLGRRPPLLGEDRER